VNSQLGMVTAMVFGFRSWRRVGYSRGGLGLDPGGELVTPGGSVGLGLGLVGPESSLKSWRKRGPITCYNVWDLKTLLFRLRGLLLCSE
jgi:hypothetical protein